MVFSSARTHPARNVIAAATCLAGCLAGPLAHAQTAPGWQVYLSPYIWVSGVSGTLTANGPRGLSTDVSASFGDVLSHLDSIPVMGAAEIRNGPFGVATDLMAISTKADIPVGRGLFGGGNAQLTEILGSVTGLYRVFDAPSQSLDLGIGVRVIDISTRFTLRPGLLRGFTVSPGDTWADPVGAVRYHADFAPSWGVTLYGDIGGGPESDVTWQVLGTIDYRLTPSSVLRFGYRHLAFKHDSGPLTQDMAMSGPILGGTFEF